MLVRRITPGFGILVWSVLVRVSGGSAGYYMAIVLWEVSAFAVCAFELALCGSTILV